MKCSLRRSSPWWQVARCHMRASRPVVAAVAARQLAVMPRSKRVPLSGISMPTKSEERWNKDGNNLKAKLEKAGYKGHPVTSPTISRPSRNADIENIWSTTTPRSSW